VLLKLALSAVEIVEEVAFGNTALRFGIEGVCLALDSSSTSSLTAGGKEYTENYCMAIAYRPLKSPASKLFAVT
jgi:hypothetical protein